MCLSNSPCEDISRFLNKEGCLESALEKLKSCSHLASNNEKEWSFSEVCFFSVVKHEFECKMLVEKSQPAA